MADPLIDEPYMLSTLALPVTPSLITTVKHGAMLSVVDAFDRKLLRDNSIDIIALSLSLTDTLARMEITESMLDVASRKELTEEKLVETVKALTTMVEEKRVKLFKLMRLVADCPITPEKVH